MGLAKYLHSRLLCDVELHYMAMFLCCSSSKAGGSYLHVCCVVAKGGAGATGQRALALNCDFVDARSSCFGTYEYLAPKCRPLGTNSRRFGMVVLSEFQEVSMAAASLGKSSKARFYFCRFLFYFAPNK
jgi:hypothetical protein